MSAYRTLKPQQRKFVDMIVRGVLPTHAIERIRPKLKRPQELASRWRALPEIEAAISERSDEAMRDAGITNAQILLGIARAANVSVHALVHMQGERKGQPKSIDELDEDTARVIQAVEFEGGAVKFRFPNRLEALKLLGQYKKLFTQKVDVDGHLTLEQLVGASMQQRKAEGAE